MFQGRQRHQQLFSSQLLAVNGDEDQGLTSTSTNEEVLSSQPEGSLEWNSIFKQARVFWDMSSPYYKESIDGRWLFAGMVVMTLLNSAVSVAFSYLGKDFWNALSARNADEFWPILVKYAVALVIGAPVAVLYRFQRERLAVHWREWMTDRTLQLYSTSSRVYYKLEQSNDIDNPDQRISEDVRTFTGFSLQLFLTIVTSVIDLVSFSFILYSIQPQLFGAIVAYAAFGTVVTTLLGNKLVGLNFVKLQREADFRYALVRLRENAESIAFYAGEDLENRSLLERLKQVISNKRDINAAQRNLEFFTTAYQYLIQILPVAVVAPQYFSGVVQLGVVSQSAGAFNHILSDLSILVNQFEQLSAFSAGIDRLSSFYLKMKQVDASRIEGNIHEALLDFPSNATLARDGEVPSKEDAKSVRIDRQPSIELQYLASHENSSTLRDTIVSVENLKLLTPDGKRNLIEQLSFQLEEGEHLLIVGDSGAGKSSLLRAIAGLWTTGSGLITRPGNEDVYFLPQRPYCALGSLKDQLLYPSIEKEDHADDYYPEGHRLSSSHLLKKQLSDNELLDILDQVTLGELASRVGDGDPVRGLYKEDVDWSNMLSLGEQQRLAFGRLLVNQPKLVILDEATSALDMVSEAKMYTLLREMAQKSFKGEHGLTAAGLTYISVGHRPSLLAYHDKKLRLMGGTDYDLKNIEKQRVDILPESIRNL